MKYNPQKVEKKWQKVWAEDDFTVWSAERGETKDGRVKKYVLDMFPYPSGSGLHVGHLVGYIGSDIVARYYRMKGCSVLHPMGWDAFGLPAENFAIKHKIHPSVAVKKNIANFKKELNQVGFSYDWQKEINTADPKYYRWTQWIFLQLFKKGLAYKAKMPVNWCPQDKTVLANEEVVEGKCERCGCVVERKELEQWVLKITAYADRLLRDLEKLDWPEKVKEMQKNWVGRSEGALVKFKIQNSKFEIEVFTTRPDTLFGATYMVLAPEHPLIQNLESSIQNVEEVKNYIETAKHKSDLERQENKEKTGVALKGIKAINPANSEALPVWVADYVLGNVGTGAIMAVPAHDERDFAFARDNKLPKRKVIRRFIKRESGEDAVRFGLPLVERNAAVCIVKHWSEDKFLCLSWRKVDWKGFVIGGIESEESAEEAGKREIFEETGYKNIRFVKKLIDVDSQFYHSVKEENRFAHFQGVYYELEDESRDEIKQEEKNLHTIQWISKKDVAYFINREDMKYIWASAYDFFEGKDIDDECFSREGILINSGKFSGMKSEDAKSAITEFVVGRTTVRYKLRDWIFSRQRYWGEPIPLLFCEREKKWIPVPENNLPVTLPDVKSYEPTGKAESPLAAITDWVNTECPECGGLALRETNTMPQWAGSCWYYLRYVDPNNQKELIDPKKEKKWLPVDLYVGGVEHAVLHLLYARFWHKFLFDIGVVTYDEPFQKLVNQGLVLGPDGQKMSKSRGNVISPEEMIQTFGADSLRMYEMFMSPFGEYKSWNPQGIVGIHRFLNRVWNFVSENKNAKIEKSDSPFEQLLHRTIKKVTEDIEGFHFNTAISALMSFLNEVEHGREHFSLGDMSALLKLLFPFAPHIAQELWSGLGDKTLLDDEPWPVWNPLLIGKKEFDLVVQVNGRVRLTVTLPVGASQKEVEDVAFCDPAIQKYLVGKTPKKTIFVPNRLINFVV